jgi:hypothetical protein
MPSASIIDSYRLLLDHLPEMCPLFTRRWLLRRMRGFRLPARIGQP